MVEAFIGIGANIGDRERTINEALNMLERHTAIEVAAVSSLIETEAVGGPPEQPKFLNGAARLSTILPPGSLLNEMRRVEDALGRERKIPWGPRAIDLDLLLYGSDVVDEPRIKVPHPRLHERFFVLIPLVEIAPDIIHPVLEVSVSELLRRLREEE